jgi:hypothetical protein
MLAYSPNMRKKGPIRMVNSHLTTLRTTTRPAHDLALDSAHDRVQGHEPDWRNSKEEAIMKQTLAREVVKLK